MCTDNIPEHCYRCTTCGRLVDMRELSQVFSHDMIDNDTGAKYCRTDEQIAEIAESLGPITSRRVGDAEEWRDGKATLLN